MKTYIGFCIVLVLSISGRAYAQSDLRFEHISVEHGLSHHEVPYSMLQDKEGFMWFGTPDGLNKYDGNTFTVWKTDPHDPENSLRNSFIIDIHEDKEGRLWVATYGGLHQIDKRTGDVTAYLIDSLLDRRWNETYTITEDQEGFFWIGTAVGLAKFDPETQDFVLYPAPEGKQYTDMDLVQEDAEGKLWIANVAGLYSFDRQTEKFTHYPIHEFIRNKEVLMFGFHLDEEGIAWVGTTGDGVFWMDTREPGQYHAYDPNGQVNDFIYFDGIYEANGYLWLGTHKGLQRIDKKTHQVTTFSQDPFLPGSLSSDQAYCIYRDRNENLWVGTQNGINRANIRDKPFNSRQTIFASSYLYERKNTVRTIMEDRTGTVWILSLIDHGIYQYDESKNKISPFTLDPLDTQDILKTPIWIHEDYQGRLWVGTARKDLYQLNRETGKHLRYFCDIWIHKIDEGPSGKLWLSSDAGIASFDPEKETFTYYKDIFKGRAKALLVSQTGELFIATFTELIRLNPTTGKQSVVKELNNHEVHALYEDKAGIIWIGTGHGGLNRLDPKTNTFTYFTTREGLPSNYVASIIGDDNGNLWLGTHEGLSRFNPTANTFANFDISDGLPANQFMDESASIRNGKLMFGTRNGFVIFHPDSIKETTTIPPVYITGFKVMEKNRALPISPLELNYDQNFLSFDFVALNYESPEKVQYAYQLVGLDKDWIYSGSRRYASYTDLAPGEYEFRVKATADNKLWNEQGASMKLIILPPWWQSWWAYGLYALLGISMLYGLIYYSVSRERLKSDLKLQRLEAEKMHEIDHLKSRFFANISHEFRTPLTLILGPLEKLLTHSGSGKERNLYQIMHRNARRLLHLINQLLDLSKLEAGSMQLETKPTAIVPFLKAIVLSFSSLAEKRHIQYHFKYPKENAVVYFDADKLEKIITNLISNAFKFTPEGGSISVSVRLNPAEGKAIPATLRMAAQLSKVTMLQMEVKDSGLGIAEEFKEKVFNRFYQINTSQTREQEGTGIGLSLVRELVELHQGEVSVESQKGRGSCFTVQLPLVMADYEELSIVQHAVGNGQQTTTSTNAMEYMMLMDQIAESDMTEADMESSIVLIVEDNADVRYFIRESLESTYQIIEACNGQEGYTKAMEFIPDLIISDVMMPGMDGIELCSKLKINEKTAHIPIILLTAKASGDNKIEGLETGADDYIIKPFEATELHVRIKNLIDSRNKLREHFSRQITLEPSSIDITSVDEKFLRQVMQIIEAHMEDVAFGVEVLSKELGMSRSQLFRKIKALTGYAPGDLIRITRLKRAAELLSQGAGNIAEVSVMAGFNDPSHFTKCFQKQYGVTPSEFMAKAL